MIQDRFSVEVVMVRRELADAQWQPIAPLVAGKKEDCVSWARTDPTFVDAVLSSVRSGAPWRLPPEEFVTGTAC
jgi:transposase